MGMADLLQRPVDQNVDHEPALPEGRTAELDPKQLANPTGAAVAADARTGRIPGALGRQLQRVSLPARSTDIRRERTGILGRRAD